MFDMSMMIDMCAPSSSTSDDAIKGKWVRVSRDLNLQTGMWHLVSLILGLLAGMELMYINSSYIIDVLADVTWRSYRTYNSFPLATPHRAMGLGPRQLSRCAMALCALRRFSCGTGKIKRSGTCLTMNGNP